MLIECETVLHATITFSTLETDAGLHCVPVPQPTSTE